jgi:hypothetical protein
MTAHKGRKAKCFSNWSIIEPEAINATRSQFKAEQPASIESRRTGVDPADLAITGGNAGEVVGEFGRDRLIASGKLIRQLITDGLDAISIGMPGCELSSPLEEIQPLPTKFQNQGASWESWANPATKDKIIGNSGVAEDPLEIPR